MNIHEGGRRMKQAGRWMIFGLIGAAIVYLAFLVPSGNVHGLALLGIIPLLLPIALPGAALWLAGWIVEGFAQDRTEKTLMHHN